MKGSQALPLLSQKFGTVLFYCLLLAALYQVWQFPAFISMDGPAHLYNASLLNIFKHSAFLQQFLIQNYPLLPNYLSHWVLQGLLLLTDPLNAEKMLISSIVVFLPVTFRMVTRVLSHEASFYSFLIFPLVFSNVLCYGFYNFCLGFIFLNLHICIIAKLLEEQRPLLWWPLLFINSSLLYYCHLFGYVVALLVTAAYICQKLWKNKRAVARYLVLFVLIHLPTLVLGLIFTLNNTIPFYDYDLIPSEKTLALLSFSPAITFDVTEELPYSALVSLLLLALIVHSLTLRSATGKKWQVTDFYLLFAIGLIYLIYHTTDGAMGGMFVRRLLYLVFYFLLLWVACNGVKGYISYGAIVIVLVVFSYLSCYRARSVSGMEGKVLDVSLARSFIREKTVIQSIFLSDTWFQKHLSNYLGINKEVLLFENYEAALSWFPLNWTDQMLQWRNQDRLVEKVPPDYIFIYGDHEKNSRPLTDSIQRYLEVNMQKLYESSDKFCRLYGRKGKISENPGS